MKFIITFLAIAINCLANEKETLVNSLTGESGKNRRSAYTKIEKLPFPEIKQLIVDLAEISQKGTTKSERVYAKESAHELYRHHILGEGKTTTGIKLGWFIEHTGKQITSFPMVLEIELDSPAAQAKIQSGDVIYEVDGKDTRGSESRNALVSFLASCEPDKPLKLSIKKSGDTDPMEQYHKNKKEIKILVPVARDPAMKPLEIDEKQFQMWLSSVGKH